MKRVLAFPFRLLDRRRARELTAVAANSHHIAGRIKKVWGIQSTVIYPPVDIAVFSSPPELSESENELLKNIPSHFILGASRFVPYKRLDIAIKLGELSGIPVVLAGGGPEERELRLKANSSATEVFFISNPSKFLLAELYRRAYAFSFPAFEDFGIMPVEAMAAGTPVIGLNKGGVSETVINGVTGVLLDDFSDSSLKAAIEGVKNINSNDCIARAAQFSEARFISEIQDWMKQYV